jgi:hypothetical protein
MWKAILRRKKRNNNRSSGKPQQKSPQQTLASKITNPRALCSSRGHRKGIQCARYDVGLCVVPCFAEYHTKVNLYYITLFVNTVCRDKRVIQGATDLMQQPELCNELFTPHFT